MTPVVYICVIISLLPRATLHSDSEQEQLAGGVAAFMIELLLGLKRADYGDAYHHNCEECVRGLLGGLIIAGGHLEVLKVWLQGGHLEGRKELAGEWPS